MITVKNLHKYFNRRKNNEIHVINDASLEFPQTGLVAILGESGSGKTTLMNVIGGLDNFASGTIQIDDKVIKKYSSSKIDKIRNEKIGYIFQNYYLLLQKTVIYNLMLSLNMYDISDKEKEARIDYVLNAVGMLRYKKKKVSELSGGQQQRVAIARALIKSPSLILADEPTGNLDEKNTIQIMNIIKKISEQTLVIMVSHEKNIVESYADYIINICDGQITSHGKNHNSALYRRTDDQNIYLLDYPHEKLENEVISIDYYGAKEHKLKLKIVFEKGRFYLESSNNIIMIDDSNEIKLIEEHEKELDVQENAFLSDYYLDPLPYKKTPRLSLKEIWLLAYNNLKTIGKKLSFLIVTLCIVAISVVIGIQTIISASVVDAKSLTYSDSHIYNVDIEQGQSDVNREKFMAGYREIYDNFRKANPNIEPILNVDSESGHLTFTTPDFLQLSSVRYDIAGFSYLPLEMLNENTIKYGRMPRNASEIVVDEYVLQKTLQDSTLNNIMNVQSFIDKPVNLRNGAGSYTIVGISSNNENTVYVNKWTIFAIYPSLIKSKGLTVCSVSEFKKYFDHELNITLDNNEAYVKNGEYTSYLHRDLILLENSQLAFEVIGELDFGNCPFYAVISDEWYEEIFLGICAYRHDDLDLYCENDEEKQQVKDYFESIKERVDNDGIPFDAYIDERGVPFKIEYTSQYDNILAPYRDSAKNTVASRTLIVLTIIVLSIIIVFFSMKSFVAKNVYNIGVYRAIGINKGSVILTYVFEMLLLSVISTLLGAITCFAITNLLSVILIDGFSLVISFKLFIFATIGLFIVNIIAGIIPIISYMRLTPSQLLSKYDI